MTLPLKHAIATFKHNFAPMIEPVGSILISAHMQPDDDAIGSVMALYGYLMHTYPNKKIRATFSSEYNDRWSYFRHFSAVQFGADVAEIVDEYDMFIALDTSAYNRLSPQGEKLSQFKGKKVCIDHHSNVPDVFDLNIISEDVSSTSQLIYELFFQQLESIGTDECESLMLGILGDTGWFNVNMKLRNLDVFDAVKRLVGEGQIDLETFGAKYKMYSSRTFEVIQECVRNAAFFDVSGWPKFICTFISQDFVHSGKYTDMELREGSHIYTASYNKTMKDVPWGGTFYPSSKGEVNVSLRSRPGSVNVAAIGQTTGLGGGHPGAGGLTYKK